MEALHARSARYHRSYCLAMCDVDLFKSFNDTYGHQSGDEALRSVASVMAATARRSDGVYRYGGEELLVVLPEQNLAEAAAAVGRVRRAVEGLGLPHAGGPTGVLTISAGVAAFQPGRGGTTEEVLKGADAALYRAKSAGRNRLELAGADGS